MKKIKLLIILLSILITALVSALIAVSVWANKPRGIHIDLDQIRQ